MLKIEEDPSAVNEVFRLVHTLKGMAGYMGYQNLSNLCHALENILGKVRDGSLQVGDELTDTLLAASDAVDGIISRIEETGRDDYDISSILEDLGFAEINRDPASEDYNFRVDVTLTEDCMMKSARAALIVQALSEVGKIVKTDPDEEKIDNGDFDRDFSIYIDSKATKQEIEEILRRIGEVESFDVVVLKGNTKPAGEAKLERVDTIRVTTKQVDTIMNLVGELVIGKSRLLQLAQHYNIPEIKEAVDVLGKSITRLQDEVLGFRMVKLEKIFHKLPRVVRDLSRRFGKKVKVEIRGEDTELDRSVLDEISEPLVHLIRNAVDHGVEKPEERIRNGKSDTGRISITAYKERGNVIIEIEDDGRGVDFEKIRRKAVEKGLISPYDAEKATNEQLLNLLFVPGFSTAENVTDVSGRGVGLDAVKTVVERLGGRVKILSEKGKGTKVTISLPPTVAIIKALVVRVGAELYAIPLSNVLKVVSVRESNIETIHNQKVLYIRNEIIPILWLRETFGMNGKNKGKTLEEVAVIVDKEGESLGLVVDSIIDRQEIVIKPPDGYLSKIKGIGGFTILGNGKVVPVLDVATLTGGADDDAR